jgi:hypothetical protein
MPGNSTPSLATYRVGGSDGNHFAYSSFRPAKYSLYAVGANGVL